MAVKPMEYGWKIFKERKVKLEFSLIYAILTDTGEMGGGNTKLI